MKRNTLAALLLSLAATVAPAQNVQQIHSDYEARQAELVTAVSPNVWQTLAADEETRRALEFLYAYMPWPDVADYSPAYHRAQTECALRARREMPWGKTVPEREWLHFVLPVRVNDENLDTFRTTCYEELKKRVAGLTMEEAVKEVNHWCHEYVTYKPSDSRTSSPLASMRTATDAAARNPPLPCRPCVPWAFLRVRCTLRAGHIPTTITPGLGLGRRQMVLSWGLRTRTRAEPGMVQPACLARYAHAHQGVCADRTEPEDVIARTDCYTEINVTADYAQTARTTVTVVERKGTPRTRCASGF